MSVTTIGSSTAFTAFELDEDLPLSEDGSLINIIMNPAVTQVTVELSMFGVAPAYSALAQWAWAGDTRNQSLGAWSLDDSDHLFGTGEQGQQNALQYDASNQGLVPANNVNGLPVTFKTQQTYIGNTLVSELSLNIFSGARIYTAGGADGALNSQVVDATINLVANATGTFNGNPPPYLNIPTPAQTYTEGQHISYTLPSNTFIDPRGMALTWSAPSLSWLSFNAATHTFSGTAPSTAFSEAIPVTVKNSLGLTAAEFFSINVVAPSPIPVLAIQTPAQNWVQGKTISLVLPAGTFTDPGNEALTYTAGTTATVTWLSFDPSTRTFSGTVPAGQTSFTITVTATDTSQLAASETFQVNVTAPATNPVLTRQTATQSWTAGQPETFVLPAGTFSDPRGQALTYAATAPTAVASWLKFNTTTQTFTGTVPVGQPNFVLTVTATDTSGLSVSDTFEVDIVGDPGPVLSKQTATQNWSAGQPASFVLPAGTFTDPGNQALTYSATAPTAVISWIHFNTTTLTFSGTVPAGQANFPITVTATDTSGLSASETFEVDITGASGPVLSIQTGTQTWNAGQSLSFVLPAGTFTDPGNQALIYSATAPTAVTSWIHFNTATQTFTGTVPASQTNFSITVTATDTSGLSASDIFQVDIAGVSPSGVQPITIAGTAAGTTVSDRSVASPFSRVIITDPNASDTETVTITLSNPANGTLGILGGGTYNSATGVYTLTTTAETGLIQQSAAQLASAAIENLVFTPAQNQAAAGQTVTTTFTIAVSDRAGGTGTNGTTTVIATQTAPSTNLAPVTAAYLAIYRTAISQNYAAQVASQIDNGQTTLVQFENGLIESEQAMFTTLPALITIDAFYGATPSSANLTTVATATSGTSYYTASELHNLGYSDTNVWTVLASGWGADPTSNFYSLYVGDATGTTAGYTAFINAVYVREFGAAPTAANLGNLLADVPGTQALLNGGGHIATPIQVMAGLYGYLLEVGQAMTGGQYGLPALNFLEAAANGTATYGPELAKAYSHPAATAAAAGALASAVPDPNVITISGSGEFIDPGPGSHAIQFLTQASGDTLVLHAGGADQVANFDPTTDGIDLRALMTGTGFNLDAAAANLGDWVTVTDQAGDALVRFDPSGRGGGDVVAILLGLGGDATGLTALVANGSARITSPGGTSG